MRKRRRFNKFVKWCIDRAKNVKSGESKVYHYKGKPYRFRRSGSVVYIKSRYGFCMLTKHYFVDSKGRVWYYC